MCIRDSSNTGTWFIGRLQTVQDRERVLDGLEGAVQGGTFSRAALSDTLSSLDNRVFLLHNVHELSLIHISEPTRPY